MKCDAFRAQHPRRGGREREAEGELVLRQDACLADLGRKLCHRDGDDPRPLQRIEAHVPPRRKLRPELAVAIEEADVGRIDDGHVAPVPQSQGRDQKRDGERRERENDELHHAALTSRRHGDAAGARSPQSRATAAPKGRRRKARFLVKECLPGTC